MLSAERAARWAGAAFLLATFALPTEAAFSLVFYVAVVPAVAWLALREGGPRWGAAGWAGAAVIVWFAATLLWGEDALGRDGRMLASAASTGVLWLGLALLLPRPLVRDRLAGLLVVAGGVNAAFSTARYVLGAGIDPRLHGWGITQHPILGAAVMSAVTLTALWRALAGAPRPWRHLGVALLGWVFVLLTGSRGPLLALAAATLVLCLSGKWRGWALRVLPVLGMAAALGWRVAVWLRPHPLTAVSGGAPGPEGLIGRGASHRPEIWEHTLRLIEARPLLGHGLAANIDLPAFTFPHDLYLSLLFYGGVVGFALFGVLTGLVVWQVVRAGDAAWPWIAALGVNAAVVGLTDLGQVTKGPGALWLILWLPLALGAATAVKPSGR